MVRATILALAGASTLLSTASFAADLPPPLPAPIYRAPIVEAGGWYLRGDVGIGVQNYKSFDFVQTAGGPWPTTWRIDQKDIKDTYIFGGGIGYQWNNWLRFDFTGEYRADVKFKAIGTYFNGTDRAADVYDGDHSAVVVLANLYLDLGTWWCITPFVGVGAGGAYHKTAALSDLGINTNGLGASAWGVTANDHTQWNFAWALHAGASYTVTPSFKVEVAYRYLNMGNVNTSEVLCGASGCGTGGGPRAYYTLTNFDSHDFRIGVRWLLQQEPAPVFPLIRKG
jgi:opacity protein-like surface antigen